MPLRPQKSVELGVTLPLTQKDQETPVKGSAAWLYPRRAVLRVRAVRGANGWRLSASVTVTGAARTTDPMAREVWARGQAFYEVSTGPESPGTVTDNPWNSPGPWRPFVLTSVWNAAVRSVHVMVDAVDAGSARWEVSR